MVDDDRVRVLLRPMDLAAFEGAVRWLAGSSSESWVTPPPND